jgi:hypothetical protein
MDNQVTKEIKPLNFFIVLCKTRKKFDKYIKLHKIRSKYIIDIKKMMDEEDISAEELGTSDLFKILILKKFNLAKDKKKDIYYIPNFSITKEYGKLFNIKDLLATTHNFNLLYFYEDFEKGQQPTEILDKIADFDISQLIKDF